MYPEHTVCVLCHWSHTCHFKIVQLSLSLLLTLFVVLPFIPVPLLHANFVAHYYTLVRPTYTHFVFHVLVLCLCVRVRVNEWGSEWVLVPSVTYVLCSNTWETIAINNAWEDRECASNYLFHFQLDALMEMMDIHLYQLQASRRTHTKILCSCVSFEKTWANERKRQHHRVNGLNDVGGVLYVSRMKHEWIELSDIEQNFMQIKKAQYMPCNTRVKWLFFFWQMKMNTTWLKNTHDINEWFASTGIDFVYAVWDRKSSFFKLNNNFPGLNEWKML